MLMIQLTLLSALNLTTDEAYEKVTKSLGKKLDTVTLEDGTRGHWIGDRSAEHILVFSHGGGYALYAIEPQFQVLWGLVEEAERKGKKLAVLFLSYDVSVTAPYPRQLQQASALLQYMLNTEKKKPENIILAGDSAGGNLTLAILSHAAHKHPRVEPLKLDGRFGAAALVSPWLTFDTKTSDSMKRNKYRDVLSLRSLDAWSSLFIADATRDNYLEPLYAVPQWWQDAPVEDVLVISGANEVFVDDIRAFVKKFQSVHSKVTYVESPNEAHDEFSFAGMFNEPPSQQQVTFERWVLARIMT
ncbi:hypothetical protein MAP00_005249 [Monascus purpureus]|nr:hypothetical protein MAP00_005249 [Monascus purpureus]